MEESERSSTFSADQPKATPELQVRKDDAAHLRMEQQAAALIHEGKLQQAEAIYRELINDQTTNHVVYCNLAAICGLKGNTNDAIEFLDQALELNPEHPEALNNLGAALTHQGNLPAAIAAFRKSLSLSSDNPRTHNNLGTALKRQGDLAGAINSYNKALELNPYELEALVNLGNVLREQGDQAGAIASYNKALQISPGNPEAHYNLGDALKQQGNIAAAIASYQRAIEIRPSYPEAHNNLGNAFKQEGDLINAMSCYKRVIELRPRHEEAHYNLGNALKQLGNLNASICSYNKALEINPSHSDAHNNLGLALQEQGNVTAAIASYNRALELKPNDPGTLMNLSMAELLAGDYRSGWKRYENRLHCMNILGVLNASPSCKRWDGKEIPDDNRLLLVSEQGLGDTLQFMRYVISLRTRGIKTSLCAPSKLHRLIQVSGIDSSPLTPEQANQVTMGQWLPLLSLPGHLGVSPENPIITEPYIKTVKKLVSRWQSIMATEKRPIVGINWQGNPSHKSTSSAGRSISLETFAIIANNVNASLLSLQKGFGSEQLESCSFKDRFVTCQDQVNHAWDFLETAAIIANCDLVITIDTSVAHLAGGMGKTTWLLLKKVPEWRWGLTGETSFWYPSIRLFRQGTRGDWNEVMHEVKEELQSNIKRTLF